MSQGIQERNLPVAESIGEGDKVRIVTSAGNSKNVDASLIGGGGMVVTATYDDQTDVETIDKTYEEMQSAIQNGVVPILLEEILGGGNKVFHCVSLGVGRCDDSTSYYYVTFNRANKIGTVDVETYTYYSETVNGVMTDENPCGGR